MELSIILPISLQASDSICQYDNLQIQPSKSYDKYGWSTGALTSEITVSLPGRYILSVTDSNGCSGEDTINIYQKNCYSAVYFPSAFTPNGDQLNGTPSGQTCMALLFRFI